ncbi:MAG: hypothetical protein ACI87W_003272, partial [Halieaceae bacterium]
TAAALSRQFFNGISRDSADVSLPKNWLQRCQGCVMADLIR